MCFDENVLWNFLMELVQTILRQVNVEDLRRRTDRRRIATDERRAWLSGNAEE